MSRSNCKHTERGIALLTALVIMAIIASLAVTMLFRSHLGITRLAAIEAHDALIRHAHFVKAIAIDRLTIKANDKEEASHHYDALEQPWAQPIGPLQQGDIQLIGHITDLQGRFNVNNLLVNGDKESTTADSQQAVFSRLLQTLPGHSLSESKANVIAAHLTHWVNIAPSELDNDYLTTKRPYQVAHLAMSSPSEVRLLAGIDARLAKDCIALLSALPQRTALNVNTTSKQVLAAVLNLPIPASERLLAQQPFVDMNKFIEALTTVSEQNPASEIQQQLSVSSHYFLLQTSAKSAQYSAMLVTMLHRLEDGSVEVIWESQGAI